MCSIDSWALQPDIKSGEQSFSSLKGLDAAAILRFRRIETAGRHPAAAAGTAALRKPA
jgi:hypothetical protein